ncbi:acetyl-CoA C-acyltransferase [Conexibacter stalactiti]|uniref:Acetyl-CoA C-acyltransferase n=1 Tax=Conexibacter stalactiti TaxID=1940611 RepID=A0ABU4HWP0_9ACTN|nr:acetyl-CoA C-acyltransferase [Conexibacter stalactiti]MDW5596479.1 acetyl-CoA C-acyltransferase [Conexibacter stalactiti]MEC5037121.1 acetyl-CoA C-acyltransferase [Conexibacter stalactiti]
MAEAVIVDAVRTPIGRAGKGSLRSVRADDLAAIPLRAILARNPQLDPADVVDVMMGAANGSGEQGYNVGRNASLLAGLPISVPGCTVNRFCASSLQTLRMAFHAIRAGEGDVYIAAGVEAVSRAEGAPVPFHPQLDGSPGSLVNVYIPMGLTAENVADREGITREQQDRWALLSQTRAVAAQADGHFDREIVAVEVPEHVETTPEGEEVTVAAATVTKDDGPRPGTTAEKLAALKPVFRADGTVTAGNACPLNDGAAAVLVMSEEKANALGLKPRARIIASAIGALEPEYMGLGPIPAVRNVLKQAGMSIGDVDVIELNEAFAAQVVPCQAEWGVSDEQLNPFGGAIALGHPFGMTGARIMTTLLNDLETLDKTIGLETMCVAGGMGQAMLVERLN